MHCLRSGLSFFHPSLLQLQSGSHAFLRYGHEYALHLNFALALSGASPDRIVCDPTSNPPFDGLIIKCIESGKGMTHLQTYLDEKEHESGKKNHFV